MGIKKKKSKAWRHLSPPDRNTKGSIKADLSKQSPNNSYSAPLYYEDVKFVCRDCGKEEVWTAEQQWIYFEVWRKPFYGRAVRCRECRISLQS